MDDTENAREVAERHREAWLANDLTGILDCWLYEENRAVVDRAWSSP